MLAVCERWVGDGDRLLYWLNSTSFSFWLGCSTVGHWGPQTLSLQADSHAGILSPTDSNCPGHLVILLSYALLLPLFFRLFTQGHLLIDSSVEGQCIVPGHALGGGLTPLQRCCQCILQPQPTQNVCMGRVREGVRGVRDGCTYIWATERFFC